ncbi:LuxR C-terminal-related transcriptional regulator [Paenibacillus pabuli]|uniref:LuxR C-terminal-related transcriptional regulator n=1 Tax=Paenibacillus pabuli TaxID=1472 RepID=UPI003CEBAD73
MTQTFHPYADMNFQEFVLFFRTHSKQLEENTKIYLISEANIAETQRVETEVLMRSFFRIFTHSDMDHMDNHYSSYLDTWVQSQLSILNAESLHWLQIIFEKAMLTLLIQLKHQRMMDPLMFLLSVFSYLMHSFHKWAGIESVDHDTEENEELKKLRMLDQLNQLLVRSSGASDLAFILKKCEKYFNYKRCVFYAYVPWSNQFYGVIGEELPKVQSMKGQLTEQNIIFNSKRPIYLKNPKPYLRNEHIQLFQLSSIIFIPVAHEQQLYGWVTFDQKGDPFDCTKGELDFLEQVGKRIGLFLSRKEKENTAKTMAIVLTERESTVLDLLAEGYDNKKIASLLFLSEYTVRDYVSSLMTKLRAKNRTQVVAYAFRWGLLS